MTKRHRPPLRCYVRRAVWGASPSALLSRCTLGLRASCSKCSGCSKNTAEQYLEAFEAGLEAGKKDPWFRIDELGKVTILREMTPEEKKSLAAIKEMNRRVWALYGVNINDEEEPGTDDQETAQSL